MIANRLKSLFVTSYLLPLLVLVGPSASGSTLTWTQLSPAVSPPARSYLAMTYDIASRKVVLFGGFGGTGYLNDTWTFDGTTWTEVATPIAPSARANAQMAYDHHTHQVVLFGGYNGKEDLGDTWLWDGRISTWTQAFPASAPKAVTGPMVLTDLDGRVDLFGGFDGNLYQGTMWRWSGSDWKVVRVSMAPYARSSAGVGVNYSAKQIVMFGGLGDVNLDNTWTYDGQTWTMESPPTQPLLVYASSTTFDPNLNTVILFGGGSGGVDQNTTWSWTGSNWEELFPTQSPGPRESAGIAYDQDLGRTIIFGGQDRGALLGDTWELTP
ncbi:MAG: Kelch repeat-containing protein [Chthoniobacterales bacterium]